MIDESGDGVPLDPAFGTRFERDERPPCQLYLVSPDTIGPEFVSDLKAALGLAIWGSGCYLLYLAWHARTGWSEPYADAIGTALYLVTFFYLFAFWPIHAAVEKLFRGVARAQEGASPTNAARSSAATSRKAAGGDSSPGAGA